MDDFLAMAQELEKGKNPKDCKGTNNTPEVKNKEGFVYITEGMRLVDFSAKDTDKK